MSHVQFQLRYTLSRSQRLVPHVRLWGLFTTVYVLTGFTFFFAETVIAARVLEFRGVFLFGGLALGVLLLFRRLFVGLLDVVVVPKRYVDVVIEDDVAGILLGRERWYLFLDGITSLRKYRADVWTIQHFNGSVLHVPVSAITAEQVAHVQRAMERGRTPEGVRAVVERGRKIAAL